MAVDGLFQESTDRALDDLQQRPRVPRVASPSFSMWGTLKAAPRGAAAGVAESVAFGSEVAGAFGLTFGAYLSGTDPATIWETKEQRDKREREATAARARIDAGDAFNNEASDVFRMRAIDLMPDPQTASKAEEVVGGLSRFLPKAIGYTIMGGGPVVGAALLGADEGLTEAERLRRQGVDLATRTKVGAVAGVTAGAAVALPLAGRTVAQTTGLWALGGPGAFMGQQAASRSILEASGYGRVGEQYDPFDPVGLTLSTLIPAPFAAWGYRNLSRAPAKPAPAAAADAPDARALDAISYGDRLKLRYDDARLDAYAVAAAQREGIPPEALLAIKNAGERSGSTAVSPAGARGVMQFMPATWKAYGRGDILDPVASIDAGARYMRALIDQYGGNVRAATAHYNGGGRAGEAVMAGKAPPARETQAYLERTDAYVTQRAIPAAAREAVAADPAVVDAARVNLVRAAVESAALHSGDDLAGAARHVAAVSRAADQIAAGERVAVEVDAALPRLEEVRAEMVAAVRSYVESASRADVLSAARAELLAIASGRAEPGAVPALEAEIRTVQSALNGLEDSFRQRAKAAQGEGMSRKQAEAAARAAIADTRTELSGRLARLEQQMTSNRVAARAEQDLGRLDAGDFPPAVETLVTERAGQILRGLQQTPLAQAVQAALRSADMLPARQADAGAAKAVQPEGTPAAAPRVAREASGAGGAQADGGGGGNAAGDVLARQAGEIERLAPDLMVQFDGMEKPMRLADAMQAVKAEADALAAEANLVQVAAECALRSS